MQPLTENPRLGLKRKNPALHPGHHLPNFTAAIGDSWSVASETRWSHEMGRFLSPDWSSAPDTVPYADFNDPQTLNLYSYAGNNPLTFTDADGHNYTLCDMNGNNCQDVTDDQYNNWLKANPNVSVSASGQIYGTGADGNSYKAGTASYYNEQDQQGAAMIGFGGMGMVNMFMRNMAYNAAGGLIGRGIGLGVEALADSAAAGEAINTGTNAVYRSVNAAGDVQYVGITNDLARRAGEHAGRFAIEEIPGLSSLSKEDAKAVEQVLIETHGLASSGGNSVE
jgi:RHS repeat-associated protein